MQATNQLKVNKMHISYWPNGLGASAKVGSSQIDVWIDGSASRCEQCQHSLTGWRKTHWAKFPAKPLDKLVKTACLAWKEARFAWEKIEE